MTDEAKYGVWDGYNLCWDTYDLSLDEAAALRARRIFEGHDEEQFGLVRTCPSHPDEWADDCEKCPEVTP